MARNILLLRVKNLFIVVFTASKGQLTRLNSESVPDA